VYHKLGEEIMGLFSFLFGNSDSNSSSSEKWTKTDTKTDHDKATYSQHKYEGEKGNSKHEHTWSETTPDSHKEGWHGEDFETKNNK
jgi:hypothetical protein